MTKEQWMAMGASPDVAEALATSDRELAKYRERLAKHIAERVDREMMAVK